jgi:hypothetical protein
LPEPGKLTRATIRYNVRKFRRQAGRPIHFNKVEDHRPAKKVTKTLKPKQQHKKGTFADVRFATGKTGFPQARAITAKCLATSRILTIL